MIQSSVLRNSPIPLYYQLQELLRSAILRAELRPGQRVPSEAEFCARYHVSRITVRQAVSALVNEGLLYRERGRGTFVVGPRVSHVVSELLSFTEQMAQRGLAVKSRVLETAVEIPPEHVRNALQLSNGEEVIRIKRLRLAGDETLALQTVHLPRNRFRNIDVKRLETVSLYQALQEEYGVRLMRAHETYRPIVLKRPDSMFLNVPARSAAFYVERTTFDVETRPVEFVTSILRGDRMQVTIELLRKEGRA